MIMDNLNARLIAGTELYKKGDVVKVWSLQSFFGGGFLNGREAIVSQDQRGSSVLIVVERKVNGDTTTDPSYEVYSRQLELVRRCSDKDSLSKLSDFIELLKSCPETVDDNTNVKEAIKIKVTEYVACIDDWHGNPEDLTQDQYDEIIEKLEMLKYYTTRLLLCGNEDIDNKPKG